MNLLDILFKPKFNSLKEYKKARNLTNKQLAEYFDVSESCISHYLNGKRKPKNERAVSISKKTGIPIENLIQ